MASQPQQGAGGGAQDPNPIGTWCVAPLATAAAPVAAAARRPFTARSLRARYNDVSHRTPVITRYVILALVSTYLISWFLPSLALALTNCPTSTIGGFEIYRLFLSPFIGTQLLSVIFGSLMIHQSGGRLERSKGARPRAPTLSTLPDPAPHGRTADPQDPSRPWPPLWSSLRSLASSTTPTPTPPSLSAPTRSRHSPAPRAAGCAAPRPQRPAHRMHNSRFHLQILVIGLIVIECEAAPDQERRCVLRPACNSPARPSPLSHRPHAPRLLFLPIGIPGKYFPWAILALFALFGGSLVEMLCGLAAGYLCACRARRAGCLTEALAASPNPPSPAPARRVRAPHLARALPRPRARCREPPPPLAVGPTGACGISYRAAGPFPAKAMARLINTPLSALAHTQGFVSLDAAGAEVALPTSSNQEAVRRERQQQGGGSRCGHTLFPHLSLSLSLCARFSCLGS